MSPELLEMMLANKDWMTLERCCRLHVMLQESYWAEGHVIECGTRNGGGAAILQRTIWEVGHIRTLHVYDSFEGFPEPTQFDHPQWKKGAISCGEQEMLDYFKRWDLPPPVIHKGFFADTIGKGDCPDKVCFAHLDGDLYESILCPLLALEHRMDKNAIIVVDDYGSELFPGVKKACDEFLSGRDRFKLAAYTDQAVIDVL